MIDDIENEIERLKNVEDPDELKDILSSCCRIIIDALDLEIGIVLFYETNPILDTFAVSFPGSDYQNYAADKLDGIESELWVQKKPVTIIPLINDSQTKKIGALILVHKNVSAVMKNEIQWLKELMAKCAETIRELSLLEGNAINNRVGGKLINYAHEVVTGKEKTNEIVFEILKELDIPTRVFIASELENGSYAYYHALAVDGKIVDYKEGTLDEESLEFMAAEVAKDEPRHWEIDIDDSDLVKGKLIVGFEKSGSIFDGDVEEILYVMAPNLAGVMVFNHPQFEAMKEEYDTGTIKMSMLEGIGKRLRATRENMRFFVDEMCILLDTTEEHYTAMENGGCPLNRYELTVLKYLWLVDLDWLLYGKENE